MSGEHGAGEANAPLMWTRRLAMGLSVLWAVVIAVVFIARLTFPLELEWMEGGALQQALRIQRGDPIYGPPSADFVPFLYTPLYPALLALLGWVFPLDFVLGRLVSIASVVAICAALWQLVGQEGKPRAHQFIAVGLFLSGYVFCFRWLDLVRGDALFMALTLWALTVLREAWGDWRRALLAGALMGLAFWTKQTAFVFVVASGLAGLWVAPRQLWVYALTIAAIGLGGVVLGQQLSDGWMWTYIYELHQSHAFNWARFTNKTWGMFAHAAPLLLACLGLVVVELSYPVLGSRRRLDERPLKALDTRLKTRKGAGYWGILAAAGLLVSALGYSTAWAEPNAFIPGVTLGAAALAVALPRGGRFELVGLGLVSGHLVFALLVEPRYQPIQDDGLIRIGDSYTWQDPGRTIPGRARRARAAALRDRLEAADGPILALHRPWWAVIAAHRGRPGHMGSMGLNDVPEADRKAIIDELSAQVRDESFATVWVEGEPPRWLARALWGHYAVSERRWGAQRVRPMSGYMSEAGMVTPYTRAQVAFVPITPRTPPEGVTAVADFEDGSLDGFTTEGVAFGRRAVGSFHLDQPAIGPIGGAYALSSAASRQGLKARGKATSPSFRLPRGGHVVALLGRAGKAKGLSVALAVEGGPEIPVDVPATRWSLAPIEWPIPDEFAGKTARVVLTDAADDAALFFDDLWVSTHAP